MLRDLAVMLADGGVCLSDLAALRDQAALFGPVASTPTAWRVVTVSLGTLTGWPGCGRPGACPRPPLGGRRHPEVDLLIVDADATLVLAHTDAKEAQPGPPSTASGSRRCWPTGPRPGPG